MGALGVAVVIAKAAHRQTTAKEKGNEFTVKWLKQKRTPKTKGEKNTCLHDFHYPYLLQLFLVCVYLRLLISCKLVFFNHHASHLLTRCVSPIMITWQVASRSNGCVTSQDLHTGGDSFLKTRCPKNWKRLEGVGINKTYLSKHSVPSSILSATGQLGLNPLQYASFLQDAGSFSRHLMETLLYTQSLQQGDSYPSLRRERR